MDAANVGNAGGMAFGFAILGFIVSVPIFAIIRAWFVDGTLDAPFAVGGILGILGLTGLTWQSRGSTPLMIVFVALLIGISLTSPFIGGYMNKRGNKVLDESDIDRYRATIESDPNNVGAYVFLGDALVKRGSLTAAVAQYERALSLAPRNTELERKIKRTQQQLEGATPSVRIRICSHCEAENDASLKKCQRCGGNL
jgi:tetratricopeptide (TPR) repeat protein